MKIPRRRRLEAKTDYKLRLGLLKSEKPRLVIRKTNSYIIAQIVETEIAQDKIVVGTTSKSLIEKGWPKEKIGSASQSNLRSATQACGQEEARRKEEGWRRENCF